MFDRYLLESGAPDGYLIEDSSGVLLLEGAGSPTQQNDWPNPVRRKQQGEMTITVNLLLTTLAVAATTTVFRPAVYAPRFPSKVQQPWIAPNLLTSTLSGTPADTRLPPATWHHQPYTLSRFSAITAHNGQNLLTSTLGAVPVAVPFKSGDWPNPRATPQPRMDLTTQASIALLTAPQGTPFIPVDWRNPAGPAFPVDLRTFSNNLLGSTLAPPAAVLPFARFDQPNPLIARFPLQILTIASGFPMLDAIPPAPTPTPTTGTGGEPLRAQRQLVISRRFLQRHEVEEEEFLESVIETIEQAERPTQAPLAREIGTLSALHAITEAYNVRFENIQAARAAIQSQALEIEEDDMIAIMMILAMADDP